MTYNFPGVLTLVFIMIFAATHSQTKIIAHRGASGHAPENTLIAFQKAIDYRADFLELDVHRSKDGSIVVIHDASIDRTSSDQLRGKVSELTYDELSKVRVGYPEKFGDKYQNEKIPTLREALVLAKDKIGVCIEIKVLGVEREVLEIVKELNMTEQVIIFSFYYQVLAKIRKLDPQIRILFLKSKADHLTFDYAMAIEANALGIGSATQVDAAFMDQANHFGMQVWQWTVNDESQIAALIELGIDGIITDFPDQALQIRSKNQNQSD